MTTARRGPYGALTIWYLSEHRGVIDIDRLSGSNLRHVQRKPETLRSVRDINSLTPCDLAHTRTGADVDSCSRATNIALQRPGSRYDRKSSASGAAPAASTSDGVR